MAVGDWWCFIVGRLFALLCPARVIVRGVNYVVMKIWPSLSLSNGELSFITMENPLPLLLGVGDSSSSTPTAFLVDCLDCDFSGCSL